MKIYYMTDLAPLVENMHGCTGLKNNIKESQMEPPHIGDETPRDQNGSPYNNKRDMGLVEKKHLLTYSQ